MEYIFDGSFGLERETLRVDENGRLAQTPHPFLGNPYLDRDFCENQLELITPVCESVDELMDVLEQLDSEAENELKKRGEYLWKYSNPPHIEDESEIPIAEFTGAGRFKSEYRKRLEKRYGKRVMLYSGIHFNFSFDRRFIDKEYDGVSDYRQFRNELYFRLSKQVFRYGWLLVLLTAASPVYDSSLDGDGLYGGAFDGYASRRCGDKGYWNKFIPVLDYSSLESYINSVYGYLKDGSLFAEGELYLPVRLKPVGSNRLKSLIENGVDHIELRMFDLNPLSELGIFREDVEFAHYFLIYLMQLPDFKFTEELQKTAIQNFKSAAEYDIDYMLINGYPAVSAALGMLDDMAQCFKGHKNVEDNIEYQRSKITENRRYCVRVYNELCGDYNRKMLELIRGGK